MKYFLTTRKDYIYKIFSYASKKNLEKKIKEKLELVLIKKNTPDLDYIYFFIKCFIFGKLRKKKIIEINYQDFRVGRYLIPAIYSDYNSYLSQWSYFKNLIIKFFICGSIIKNAKIIAKNAKGAYIDHAIYLNGLYLEFFLKKKIHVYSNNYPRGIYSISPRRNIFYEKILPIKRKEIKKIPQNVFKITKNAKLIPWMSYTNYASFEKKKFFSGCNYIIYAHSFTDAQMIYGYDGFVNTFDWLDFTIKELAKKNVKILIKPHPNFYTYKVLKKDSNKTTFYDSIIYKKIIKKYQFNKNIVFLKKPINNLNFLKYFDINKTILVSHHGTSILEGAFLGFKNISSSSSPWEDSFLISNTFKNVKEYSYILNLPIKKLKDPLAEDLKKVLTGIYYNKYGIFGSRSFFKLLKTTLKLKNQYQDIMIGRRLNNYLADNNKIIKTIDLLSKNIVNI